MNKTIKFLTTLLLLAVSVGAWADGTLVLNLSDLSEGTYFIAAKYNGAYFTVPSTTISTQTFNCTTGTFDDETNILEPSNTAGEFVLTPVNGVVNAFYIFNNSLNKYLVATGSKTFGYVDNESSNYGYWTFSDVESGGFSGKFSVKHNNKTHYMRAYGGDVKCYDGASNDGVYFFRKITEATYTITPTVNNDSWGTVTLDVNRITATPSVGYRINEETPYTVTAGTATVSRDGNVFTVNASSDCTVQINFEAIPTYTVTLGDDNTTLTEETGNAGVVLPTRNAIGEYTFAGWSETNVETETTAAPTIIPVGTYHPTDNITLYPVYTRTEGGGTTQNNTASVTIADYASANGWENGTAYQPLTMDDNISVGGTVSGNNFKYYSSDSSWRFYTDGSFTISASNGATLSSVTLTFNGGTLKYGDTSITSGTAFNVSGNTAKISCTANAKVTDISVTYTIPATGTTYYWSSPIAAAVERPVIDVPETFTFSTTATITCATEGASIKYSFDNENWSDYTESLTITETKTIYAKGVKGTDESEVVSKTTTKQQVAPTVTINATGITNTNVHEGTAAGTLAAAVAYDDNAIADATVTWSGNNNEVATIDAETGAVTLVAAGTVTFTATYAGNSDYAQAAATYEMTVTNTDPNAPGTQNNPYTVAQAIAATPSTGSTGNVYIHGIVSSFYKTSIMDDGSYYRYYISDDGSTGTQLLVFKGKDINQNAFDDVNDLLKGDEVIIYGKLTTYQNAPEVAADNYIVSKFRKELNYITLSGNYPTTFVEGREFSHEGIVVTAHYNDDSTKDVTSEATFSEPVMTQIGVQTVTVSFNGVSTTYTITITEAPSHTATFSVNGETYSTASFKEGVAIVFPSDAEAPEGYSIVGWLTEEMSAPQDEAPANIISSAVMGIADVTYYAVLAKGSSSQTNNSKEITANTENVPDSYGTANTFTEYTLEGVKFMVQQMYKNGEKLQWRAAGNNNGTGTMYNVDAINKIQSVVLTYDNSDTNKNFTLKVGNKANPTDGTSITPTSNGNAYTFDCSANDVNYFVLTNGSGAGYLTSLVINYIVETSNYSNYCTTIPVPVNDIVITSALWATYVPNQDVTIPEDVTAYIVTNATSTSVTLSSVASAPANTGLVVNGAQGTYTPTAAETTDDVSGNLLVVSDGTVKGDGATIYALGNKGGTVGFKRVANGVNVPASKPYLTIESSGSKDFFDFSFDEGVATGIESVESVGFDMNAPVYDLQGRQVNRLYKGIFIQNGKKIIVK